MVIYVVEFSAVARKLRPHRVSEGPNLAYGCSFDEAGDRWVS